MLPILYSFRRCPYAMRARLAIHFSGIEVEQRDILLKDKPADMLSASPKGTVPVLVLPCGEVIDESRDIMDWALTQGPEQSALLGDAKQQTEVSQLLDQCDFQFKPGLDKYKYWVGYPEFSQQEYRLRAEVFLQQLEQRLSQHPYLLGSQLSLADLGIFPFIRQFANVDINWFEQAPYPCLQQWLKLKVSSPAFVAVMHKHPIWQAPADPDETYEG